jgi:hypothetical protein
MPWTKITGLDGLEEKKRPRGQRVLSGWSGARAGGRVRVASKQVSSNMTSFENRTGSNTAMIP